MCFKFDVEISRITPRRFVDLVVSLLNRNFKATYYKPPGRPNLILRERTKTDDEALVAEAFQAAVAKARELGWIV